jgi:hypothetical protein
MPANHPECLTSFRHEARSDDWEIWRKNSNSSTKFKKLSSWVLVLDSWFLFLGSPLNKVLDTFFVSFFTKTAKKHSNWHSILQNRQVQLPPANCTLIPDSLPVTRNTKHVTLNSRLPTSKISNLPSKIYPPKKNPSDQKHHPSDQKGHPSDRAHLWT